MANTEITSITQMKPHIVRLNTESNSSFGWSIQEAIDDFTNQCKSDSISKVVLIGCNNSGTTFLYNMAQCSDLEASGMAMKFVARKTSNQ